MPITQGNVKDLPKNKLGQEIRPQDVLDYLCRRFGVVPLDGVPPSGVTVDLASVVNAIDGQTTDLLGAEGVTLTDIRVELQNTSNGGNLGDIQNFWNDYTQGGSLSVGEIITELENVNTSLLNNISQGKSLLDINTTLVNNISQGKSLLDINTTLVNNISNGKTLNDLNTKLNEVITALTTNRTPLSTIGFTSYYKLLSLASTNANNIKSTPATIGFMTCSNSANGSRYLKLYNKASAPVVGTDVPTFTFEIPANGHRDFVFPAMGLNFTNGLSIAMTLGVSDANNGAVTSDALVLNISFV